MAVKTLSIPKDLDEFLFENPDLSPSKMLQSKIIEIKENRRLQEDNNLRKTKMLNKIQSELWKANDKIELLEAKLKKCGSKE